MTFNLRVILAGRLTASYAAGLFTHGLLGVAAGGGPKWFFGGYPRGRAFILADVSCRRSRHDYFCRFDCETSRCVVRDRGYRCEHHLLDDSTVRWTHQVNSDCRCFQRPRCRLDFLLVEYPFSARVDFKLRPGFEGTARR